MRVVSCPAGWCGAFRLGTTWPSRTFAVPFCWSSKETPMSGQTPRDPSTATFLPTLYCSRRCVYCNVKLSPQPEDDAIPLRRLEKVFAELREAGVEVLRMSGGDPFARRDLFDVIEIAIEEDLEPDLPAKLGL